MPRPWRPLRQPLLVFSFFGDESNPPSKILTASPSSVTTLFFFSLSRTIRPIVLAPHLLVLSFVSVIGMAGVGTLNGTHTSKAENMLTREDLRETWRIQLRYLSGNRYKIYVVEHSISKDLSMPMAAGDRSR
jgi:hypothetical protein